MVKRTFANGQRVDACLDIEHAAASGLTRSGIQSTTARGIGGGGGGGSFEGLCGFTFLDPTTNTINTTPGTNGIFIQNNVITQL